MSRFRWWPAALILVIALAFLGWTWLLMEGTGQDRVQNTLICAVLGGMALFLWLALFSGIPWRLRWKLLVGATAAMALAASLFEIKGVSGDLVPIVGLRWSPEPGSEDAETTAQRSPSPAAASPAPGIAPPRAAAAEATEVPEPVADPPTEADTPPIEEALEPPSATEWAAAPEEAAPAPVAEAASAATPPATPEPAYPQFLGPNRNAKVSGVQLSRDWTANPPREVWRRPVGAGWSGFAIQGDLAVTQEQHGEEERVVAYSLATGEELWSHADRARYSTVIGGTGPRSTPTLVGGRAYTLGATGILNALDLATGALLWSRDVLADHRSSIPEWGKSCSPLVADGRVIVSAGGAEGRSLVAYDADDGSPLWTGGSDRSSYSSPMAANLAGREQVVIFNQASVAGHDPETGELLWEYGWSANQPNVAQPLPLGEDRLFVSSGYGVGGKMLRLVAAEGELKVEELWASPRLKAKFTNVVEHEGVIYGLDDGVLVALDPATGERLWKRGRYGHGQVILAEDLLLVQTERGEVILVDPNPQELTELGTFEALEGKSWNNPALAGRFLVVRNDREAVCYELPVEG